ncbi:MAG: GNAT family N-acetyltransferase [Thermomicrobiales bacterium]
MDQSFHFVPVSFAQIEHKVKAHLALLPSATDSFHEEHVIAARHYQISVDDAIAGFASVHGESSITQFVMSEPYRHLGQPVYARLRRHEHVQAALVPTNDEFFLSHALDDFRQLAKQACFFALASTRVKSASAGYTLRLADARYLDLIRQETGDFFETPERHIANGEIFVIERENEVAGFGVMEMSRLYEKTASIGMFTVERFRNQGVGATTIALLIGECQRRDIRPVAGCWYYNHSSKRTLEKAGMSSSTRYLRIEY